LNNLLLMCTFRTKLLCSSKTIHRIFIFLGRGQHYSQFCTIFCCHGNGSWWAKMRLAAFNGPSPSTPYRRKNFAKIPYTSQVKTYFVPNFVAMATGVNQEKMQLAAFDGPSPEPPIGAKISYASRVIAHFVPNFVAMATVVGRGKMQLAAFNGQSQSQSLVRWSNTSGKPLSVPKGGSVRWVSMRWP